MISFNKGILELLNGDSRARASRSFIALVGVKLGGSRFRSSRLEDGVVKKTSVHSLVLFLDPFVKTR